MRERTCLGCGQTGVRSDSDYCSAECKPPSIRVGGKLTSARIRAGLIARGTTGNTWVNGPCTHCSQTFTTYAGASLTCSPACSRQRANQRRNLARKGRKKIRRIEVFERDDYQCWICEQPTDPALVVPAWTAPTVDHVLPRIHGGSDDPDNLRCAHFICNTRRGAPLAA